MRKYLLIICALAISISGYAQDTYPKSQTSEYAATVFNTNFTVPILRFNRTTGDPAKKGNVAFFNSIGAGIGISGGRLEVTADSSGKPVNMTMHNTVGFQAGFLFAANTEENATNIFALTAAVTLLNFQIGYGYELGTVQTNQKRGFVTVAYSIPLAKLVKGGMYIWKRTEHPIGKAPNGSSNPKSSEHSGFSQ